jgi:hypothetical protein
MAKRFHKDLEQWHLEASHFLGTDMAKLSNQEQLQSNNLRLAYAHAVLLVHQPFMDVYGTNSKMDSDSSKALRMSIEESVQECLKVATSIAAIIDGLYGAANLNVFFVSLFHSAYKERMSVRLS